MEEEEAEAARDDATAAAEGDLGEAVAAALARESDADDSSSDGEAFVMGTARPRERLRQSDRPCQDHP